MTDFNNIDELEQYLIKANRAYRDGYPIISDAVYDQLENQLKAAKSDSIIFKSFSDDEDFLKTEPHTIAMRSQDKALELKEMNKFYNRTNQTDDLFCSLKIDGASMELTYVNGKLVKALTRGDGHFGANATIVARENPDIPQTIPVTDTKVIIRGELCMPKKNLSIINEILVSQGRDPFMNTRNGTTAIMKTKKNLHLAKYLTFKAFDIMEVPA